MAWLEMERHEQGDNKLLNKENMREREREVGRRTSQKRAPTLLTNDKEVSCPPLL